MNHLCCPICSQVLRNPVTILCGHNFCMRCIQDCWGHDQWSISACSCPECGHMFPSRPRLIRNSTLANLVRETERGGNAGNERMPALKRPHSWTGTGIPLCERHSCPLDVYCCTNEQVICAECASAEHTGHTFGPVTLERRRKQEELKNIQAKSKQILQKQEKKWNNLVKTLGQIEEEARNTEDYCESILVKVIDSLQKHYLSVRELIAAQEEAAAAQVQTSIKTLEGKMKEMRKRSSDLERLAQTESDVKFLEGWPLLGRLCEKDHLHPLCGASEDPLLPFKLTKRAVEELGRQLEEFCDKEFASISQNADRGEQQESAGETEDDMQQRCESRTAQSQGLPEVNAVTVGAKTRAKFLQYTCELSLDPTTAHKDLAISAGGKKVKLNPHTCNNSAMRHPERFSHRRQVLCREPLQAERCYYEIEVEGEQAEIALAYKGIDRKSRTALSAFGGNACSWSLDRSTSYSVSHRGDSIQLTTVPSHRRIGVYLEFKKGALSFYEVSDSMKFLYKVEAEFTEPLYPGFWLGDKCCIRICDLRGDRL
ncbi:tripartite motif-containing protein 16-like [Symphorus nematophorus]